MYKRLPGVIIFVFSLSVAHAQLSISLHEPPAGIVQKSQLWNITLIYSGNTPVNVNIGLSISGIRDNQPVMTAMTRPVTLTKGLKQLRAADVGPVDYNYFSSAFNISRVPEGLLPIGSYKVCYTVYTDLKSPEGILAEDCMTVEVEPLSAPQLNMPNDSAVIETSYPQFSWLPPAPLSLFSDLNYDLLVAEVMPGQTANTAIQENLPVYTVHQYHSIVNNLPPSNRGLDTGKIYAWRVVAKNGEMFAAQSDVWTFTTGTKKPDVIVPANGMYLELKRNEGYISTGVIPDNILGIKYYSYDRTHNTTIRFLNDRGEVMKEISRPITYGNNFLVFRLDHSFSKETVYSIEITDLQSSKYSASFSISK